MFVNGSFELVAPDGGPQAWTYSDSYVQCQPYGVGGSLCAQIRSKYPFELGNGGIEQEVTVVPGLEIALTYYLWAFAFTLGELNVEWSEDGGSIWSPIRVIDYTEMSGLVEPVLYSDAFIPTSSPIKVRWQTTNGTTSSYWWLDNCLGQAEVVDIMAVLLGEFAVPAMLKTLQDNFATEVSAINTERSDAEVQLSGIERWYCYEREWASPDINECEVYIPPDGISFPRMPAQLSRWAIGQRVPLDSDVEIVVAVNHANRGGVSGATLKRSDMWKLNQRYAAAVLRVVRNIPNLGYANDLVAVPQRVRTESRRVGNEDTRFVDRVEVTFSVSQQESSSGENTPGGGVPPVAVLES